MSDTRYEDTKMGRCEDCSSVDPSSHPHIPTSPHHFSLFSLPPTFTLDEAALKQRYFELQREHHPDKAGLEGVQKSMEINQAYQTLMDPLKRAQYLLALHGLYMDDDMSSRRMAGSGSRDERGMTIKPSMELLEEMMEKREAVMELDNADATKALLAQAVGEYEQELARFTELSSNLTHPASGDTPTLTPPACGGGKGGALSTNSVASKSPPSIPPASEVEENAAQSLLRLQYITKWQGEIKQQMRRLKAA